MLVDGRPQGHEAAHLVCPGRLRLIPKCFQQAEQADNGSLAVCDEVDVSIRALLVSLREDVAKGTKNLLAVCFELRDDLHIAKVMVEDPAQIEGKQSRLFRKKTQALGDCDRLDHLVHNLRGQLEVSVAAIRSCRATTPRSHSQPL